MESHTTSEILHDRTSTCLTSLRSDSFRILFSLSLPILSSITENETTLRCVSKSLERPLQIGSGASVEKVAFMELLTLAMLPNYGKMLAQCGSNQYFDNYLPPSAIDMTNHSFK